MGASWTDLEAKVLAGERLSPDDGRRLFAHPNLPELGALADEVRQRLHPGRTVTYVVGRNINYTNVCWVQCSFCAFYRLPSDTSGEAYTLPAEAIFQKIEELLAVDGGGPVELLLQGGLNPKLRVEWYEELFSEIRRRYPTAWLHALSATEIQYIAKLSKLSLPATLARLQAAGLGSIPGAGAEMLSDNVRAEIAPFKETTAQWLEVMREAHRLGLRSSATMMYGSTDSTEDRLQHLLRIRELQDETGGFTAFIPWSFQPAGTPLGERLAAAGWQQASGFDYLRTVAVSRLLLDNVPHLQASWVTQGQKIGQISLHYGVDDFGSTMLEENVVSAAGTHHTDEMTLGEMRRLIASAGYTARRRTTLYAAVEPLPANA
ncbi:MAG: dehypoxanthine futalosine cyclase [Fimbriimonadaceae bacterium]|nr:dehypoxanthine futalosine cyclase [Fimbriimonadaceae bacterium]